MDLLFIILYVLTGEKYSRDTYIESRTHTHKHTHIYTHTHIGEVLASTHHGPQIHTKYCPIITLVAVNLLKLFWSKTTAFQNIKKTVRY